MIIRSYLENTKILKFQLILNKNNTIVKSFTLYDKINIILIKSFKYLI
jgi:hypothetical protein